MAGQRQPQVQIGPALRELAGFEPGYAVVDGDLHLAWREAAGLLETGERRIEPRLHAEDRAEIAEGGGVGGIAFEHAAQAGDGFVELTCLGFDGGEADLGRRQRWLQGDRAFQQRARLFASAGALQPAAGGREQPGVLWGQRQGCIEIIDNKL